MRAIHAQMPSLSVVNPLNEPSQRTFVVPFERRELALRVVPCSDLDPSAACACWTATPTAAVTLAGPKPHSQEGTMILHGAHGQKIGSNEMDLEQELTAGRIDYLASPPPFPRID